MNASPPTVKFRIDKWLWAARFFKTRGLAVEQIEKNRVSVNGQPVKASREVRLGDRVDFRQGEVLRSVIVQGLSDARGPAPVAQALYAETPESIALREKHAAERAFTADPSQALEQGRPTKRDRRKLVEWNRWSAASEP